MADRPTPTAADREAAQAAIIVIVAPSHPPLPGGFFAELRGRLRAADADALVERVAQAVATVRRKGEVAGWRARGEADAMLCLGARTADPIGPLFASGFDAATEFCAKRIRALPDEPPDLGGKETP